MNYGDVVADYWKIHPEKRPVGSTIPVPRTICANGDFYVGLWSPTREIEGLGTRRAAGVGGETLVDGD